MLRSLLIIIALGVFFCFTMACGEESPCATQWRQYCTCCKTQSEKNACTDFIERTYLPNTSTLPTDAERKDCAEKVKKFACKNVPEVNIIDFCQPK